MRTILTVLSIIAGLAAAVPAQAAHTCYTTCNGNMCTTICY
jgi:hypothetical protein